MLKSKNNIIKILLGLIIAICFFICFKCSVFNNCNAWSIKSYINSFGIFSPIVYIIMFTLVPLTLFPDGILAVSGGMAFGVVYGTIYTIIGAVCGGTLSFYIARFLGRSVVDKLVYGKGKWFEDGVEKKGFLIIFTLRLIPLVPFDIISYAAGLSKIKFKEFLLATVFGIMPGVFIFTNLGDKFLNIKSPEFIIAAILLISLFLVSYFMKRKLSSKKLGKNIKCISKLNIKDD